MMTLVHGSILHRFEHFLLSEHGLIWNGRFDLETTNVGAKTNRWIWGFKKTSYNPNYLYQ